MCRGELSFHLYLAAVRLNKVVGGRFCHRYVSFPAPWHSVLWETEPPPHLASAWLNEVVQVRAREHSAFHRLWCEQGQWRTELSDLPAAARLNDVLLNKARQHFCFFIGGVKGACRNRAGLHTCYCPTFTGSCQQAWRMSWPSTPPTRHEAVWVSAPLFPGMSAEPSRKHNIHSTWCGSYTSTGGLPGK